MRDVAVRVAAAHGDTADLIPAGDDWAVVSGVPCQHIALPYPWATTGRILALRAAPTADTVTEVAAWLRTMSPQWTLMVRTEHEHEVRGYQRWDLLPVLVLQGRLPLSTRSVADIGPASDRDEFLAVYGAELAPLVTEAHLATQRMHHLIARVDGKPVGCARVRLMADTAYVGAITVIPAWQGKGVGTMLTIASSQLAARYSDVVWLHCTPASRALYERLGYRHVDDHSLVVPMTEP
jgi:ribosomal protein S18 acetylase RimI-like enzyme